MRVFALPVVAMVVAMACASQSDLAPIDDYLDMWDRFAQGDNALVPSLKEAWPDAQACLVKALTAKDPRAPSRIVFLMMVQVGGAIPVDSRLGRAWSGYVRDFPVTKRESGDVYFAADFYSWWKGHQSNQFDIPLLREWLSRDFARTSVIPMYERLAPRTQ